MFVHDILHLVAVSLTTIGAFVHPAWRKRGSLLGLVAMAFMLFAMIDVAYVKMLGFVVWTPMLIVLAIALAATRSAQRRTSDVRRNRHSNATIDDSMGLLAMAALLPLMHATVPVSTIAGAGSHHTHAASPAALIMIGLLIAGAHAFGAFITAAKTAKAADRLQHLVMGTATAFMAISAIT